MDREYMESLTSQEATLNIASWMCSAQIYRELSLQKMLVFGCHAPLPAQPWQWHQKKPFCSFSICGGIFAKGLILAPWFVPTVPRIPRGSHSQSFPTLGLLSPPQAMAQCKTSKSYNSDVFWILPMLCLQSNKIRFCSLQERKQFLTKYSNLGN